MPHSGNAIKFSSERNLRGPHRRVGVVRISRRQGWGGTTASWRFYRATTGTLGTCRSASASEARVDTPAAGFHGRTTAAAAGRGTTETGGSNWGWRGGIQHQQRGRSPQQLSADAPRHHQQKGWPTQLLHNGGTPLQPQQGWGPEQGGEGRRWEGGAVGAVSPRQQQSNWQQQQSSAQQQQLHRSGFKEVSAWELEGSGQRDSSRWKRT